MYKSHKSFTYLKSNKTNLELLGFTSKLLKNNYITMITATG